MSISSSPSPYFGSPGGGRVPVRPEGSGRSSSRSRSRSPEQQQPSSPDLSTNPRVGTGAFGYAQGFNMSQPPIPRFPSRLDSVSITPLAPTPSSSPTPSPSSSTHQHQEDGSHLVLPTANLFGHPRPTSMASTVSMEAPSFVTTGSVEQLGRKAHHCIHLHRNMTMVAFERTFPIMG